MRTDENITHYVSHRMKKFNSCFYSRDVLAQQSRTHFHLHQILRRLCLHINPIALNTAHSTSPKIPRLIFRMLALKFLTHSRRKNPNGAVLRMTFVRNAHTQLHAHRDSRLPALQFASVAPQRCYTCRIP